jgi:hypothetical protein
MKMENRENGAVTFGTFFDFGLGIKHGAIAIVRRFTHSANCERCESQRSVSGNQNCLLG